MTTTPVPPRWAFERVETLRAAHYGTEPNTANIDVLMADPNGWAPYHAWAAHIASIEKPPHATDQRHYPELLDSDEAKALLTIAEQLWADLQTNELGGFSGINRPFWIVHHFKTVIETFGHRDVGLHWSKNQLDAHPDQPK